MKRLPKQEYTAEFRELAVQRVKGGQSNGVVARELELGDQTLRNWVKAFDAGRLNAPGARAVTPEQMELSRARSSARTWRISSGLLHRGDRPSRRSSFHASLLSAKLAIR